MPAISVIMPFYNAAATVEEALASVLEQSWHDFELIAVDDGSDDEGPQRVAAMARRDPRIRLIHGGRRGQVGATNLGLTHAGAPLVARMDADDRMRRERLILQHDYLQRHPDVALVGCQVHLFPEEAIQTGFHEYIRWQNACLTPAQIADEIYIELPIAHPTIMFRREAVEALGGYHDGEFPEDYDLLLRLHHAGHAMAKLPQVLFDWRDGPTRLTRTDPRYSREAFDRLRARYLARDPRLDPQRPLAFWGAGRKTRKRAAHLIAQGHTPSTWIDIDPNKIGNRLNGVPVVGPDWLQREEKPFVLSYVANHGARELIAADLEALGYRRGRDYLMVG